MHSFVALLKVILKNFTDHLMRTSSLQILVFSLAMIFCALSLDAQNVKVEVGPGEIAANEAFTITVIVENSQLKKMGRIS